MFNLIFERENYLISLPPALWIPLCKFRCRNHKLPVEKCRHNSEDEVGDEFHYVLKCTFFAEQRLLLLGKRIFTHPSTFTFNHVINRQTDRINFILFYLIWDMRGAF